MAVRMLWMSDVIVVIDGAKVFNPCNKDIIDVVRVIGASGALTPADMSAAVDQWYNDVAVHTTGMPVDHAWFAMTNSAVLEPWATPGDVQHAARRIGAALHISDYAARNGLTVGK